MADDPSASTARDRRAVVLAGHTGDVDAARLGLAHPEPTVRAAALGALRRCAVLTREELAAALADPDPSVRRRALELAAADEGRLAADLALSVAALLDDPDDTVVETAAWACGECLPALPGTVERLGGLATDADDALVREAAVAALGAIGDEAGLPAILRATEDKATVRRRAVLALAPFDGPEVDAALERALGDRDWQVRQAAEDLTQH